MEWSSRISELRKELGVTRNELATLLGTTERTIARWETGQVMPSGKLLDSLRQLDLILQNRKRRDQLRSMLTTTTGVAAAAALLPAIGLLAGPAALLLGGTSAALMKLKSMIDDTREDN